MDVGTNENSETTEEEEEEEEDAVKVKVKHSAKTKRKPPLPFFVCFHYETRSKLRVFDELPEFAAIMKQITTIYPSTKRAFRFDDNNEMQIANENDNSADGGAADAPPKPWNLRTKDGDWIDSDEDWKHIKQSLHLMRARTRSSSTKANASRCAVLPFVFHLHFAVAVPNYSTANARNNNHVAEHGPIAIPLSMQPTNAVAQYNPLLHSSNFNAVPISSNATTVNAPQQNTQSNNNKNKPSATATAAIASSTARISITANGGVVNDGRHGQPVSQSQKPRKRKLNEVTPPILSDGENKKSNNSRGSSATTAKSAALITSEPPFKKKLRVDGKVVDTTVVHNEHSNNNSSEVPSQTKDLAIPETCALGGVYYKDGYVWCDACNQWIDLHSYEQHQGGKKHRRNIDAYSFRSVLKHWQSVRTSVITDAAKADFDFSTLVSDFNLWYAQICLSCLSEVQTSSWEGHAMGSTHISNFMKCPRVCSFKRALPMELKLKEHSNTNSATAHKTPFFLPKLFSSSFFRQIANYVQGSKILVLGEQDFSYSLAVCNILETGHNIVGTSYLDAFDAGNSAEPEVHPADDGERARFFRKTLPSHSGKLQANLQILRRRFAAQCAHSIDATKLLETLQNSEQALFCGPFDIIAFPFPRASLRRGLDFRNSTLIQGFFNEMRIHRQQLMFDHSQIQFIVLGNQFKEWDVANIALENGWILKWRCKVDFNQLPGYQPRELSGKAWKPSDAILLVFLWDKDFNLESDEKLRKLNSVNDYALIPEHAMKLTKKAIDNDRLHFETVKQMNISNPSMR